MKIYYFGASHCPQCQSIRPRFDALVKAKGISDSVVIVDCDEDLETPNIFMVRAIPYIIVVNDDNNVIRKGSASDMLDYIKEVSHV